MAVSWVGRSGLLLVACLFLSLVDGTGCPNQAFKLVAGYRQSFRLNTDGRFWIAFGGHGKWSVELVDSKWGGKKQIFKCKENYFDAVAAFDASNEQERPICCAAPHDIDQYIRTPSQPPKAQPFAVLPEKTFNALHSYATKAHKTPYGDARADKFYWMLGPTNSVNAKVFWRWRRVQITKTKYESPMFQNALITSGAEFECLPHAEDEVPLCLSSDALQCDTGITADIVVFEIHCKHLNHIRFGFSSTGIFDMTFFRCLDGTKHDSEVYYYPVTRLFPRASLPSYNSLRLGWKLGAFCASCPMIKMKMSITEKQSRNNRHRLQNAVTMHVKATVEARYTRSWFDEAGETLTSGKATMIIAECNGFYLWYWTVSVGTWGEGDVVIPTQMFYCTDRTEEPVCKPRIAGMKDTDGFGKLCNGHDVDADFKPDSEDVSKPWQSMHGGRPRPIRLQGQRGVEPQLQVMQSSRAAAGSGYETYTKDTSSKGLFVAAAVIEDDALDNESDEETASAMTGDYWQFYTVGVAVVCITALAGCCFGFIIACVSWMVISSARDKNLIRR